MYSGYVAGAMQKEDYIQTIEKQGFKNIIIHKHRRINIPDSILQQFLNEEEIQQFHKEEVGVISITVSAYKSESKISGSRDYFNKVANNWDTMRSEFFSENLREKAIAKAMITSNKTATDIGAGTGFMSEILLTNQLNVIAIDE